MSCALVNAAAALSRVACWTCSVANTVSSLLRVDMILEQLLRTCRIGLGQLQISLSKFQLGLSHATICIDLWSFDICQDLPLLHMVADIHVPLLDIPIDSRIDGCHLVTFHVTWKNQFGCTRLYHGDRRLSRHGRGRRELFAILDSWIDSQEIDGNTDRNYNDCRYQSLQDCARAPRTGGVLIS